MAKKTSKKKNPQDTTLRNLRAQKKRIDVLESKVDQVFTKLNIVWSE